MVTISFDSHKRYTVCLAEEDGKKVWEGRIEHERGMIKNALARFDKGESVAVETIGNWYWIVEEIEQAGLKPLLVNARKAKLMMGNVNKTDRLDVAGLNRLQRNGVLPTVWIPPMDLRDKRDLLRTRMYLVSMKTRAKNRIHATLEKYGVHMKGVSGAFLDKHRPELIRRISLLPEQTARCCSLQLEILEELERNISGLDEHIADLFEETEEVRLLRTMPGIGFVFGMVIMLEVGDVSRFPCASRLASYSGTTPTVHASGGKTRYGRLRNDVNRYLKWSYLEAGNAVSMNRRYWPTKHVTALYNRIRERKGHQKAVGAVARHLAEATWHILRKREPYEEPKKRRNLPTVA